MNPYNLVLALSSNERLDEWIALALRLAPTAGVIHIRGLITVEPDESLSASALAVRAWRNALRQAALKYPAVEDEAPVHVAYRPFDRLLDEVIALKADLLLADWPTPDSRIGGVGADDLFRLMPCDVVLVSGANWQVDGDVLLSLRGGPNMSLGVRVAQALADQRAITVFHAADRGRSAPDLELMMRAIPQISRTVTAVTAIADGIVQEAAGHKAIVMGASFQQPENSSAPDDSIFGVVHALTGLPVILVRGARPEALEFHLPQLLTPAEEPVSTRVDRWFAQNTFHSSEFSDLDRLLALKRRQNLTISLVLPTLNEAETIGSVIQTLKHALMGELPLVDEMILIDSNSSDDTVAIAQACGIPIYQHSEILREHAGGGRGKGEALWKSLYVTKGDVIVWTDTDITNMHPRFVYGLVGPLLKHQRVQYVKGFYTRPIHVDGKLQPYGGGRVTELVARPLLNLFYPELSGIIQPLSGEYAGRRAALEQIPFFSGYGVEIGLLIDLLEQFGLDGIAQSDLEVRIHHNQPLANLSKMSFAILQVLIARIESRYGVRLLDQNDRSMKLIIQEPDRFALELAEITEVERSPMMTVTPYREKHGLL